MKSIFKLKKNSEAIGIFLICLSMLLSIRIYFALNSFIVAADPAEDTVRTFIFSIATFSYFISITLYLLTTHTKSFVLKHYFIMCIVLANIVAFAISGKDTAKITGTIEICLIFIVLALLSRFFSIYPIFSRSERLRNVIKFNSILTIILLSAFLLLTFFVGGRFTFLISIILLITGCAISLLCILYVISMVIKNANMKTRRELFAIMASLLLSILPMFALNITLGFFDIVVSYEYLLPTLLIFPTYLFYSFHKFDLLKSGSFKTEMYRILKLWNALMLLSMITFYLFFNEQSTILNLMILHSFLLFLTGVIHFFRTTYFTKKREQNFKNNSSENIYRILVNNNVALDNYYFSIEHKHTEKSFKFPNGTFNYPDLMQRVEAVYETSTIAINKIDNVLVYVKKTPYYNAFFSLNEEKSMEFSYDDFSELLSKFDFFITNYSSRMMDEEYQEKLYLSNSALETERERLSQFLHDDILQNVILALNEVKRLEIPDDTKNRLEDIMGESVFSIREACEDLFPADLDDFGLKDSLNGLIRRHLFNEMVDITFEYHAEHVIIDKLTKISAYRIIKELLNNAVKHAEAEKIEIIVSETQEALSFIVKDNGKGMTNLSEQYILEQGSNNGLKHLVNQVKVLNGKINFDSQYPKEKQKGLVVTVTLPLE